VSALRPPRESRRTPVGGIPAQGGGNALADLLHKNRPPEVAMAMPSGRPPSNADRPPPPPVAGMPGSPQPLQPHLGPMGALPPGAMPPGQGPGMQHGLPGQHGFGPVGSAPSYPFPAPQGAPFTTRQMQASLELDEIPDKYKIRGGRLSAVWIAAGALVLAAVVAAVLIAAFGGEDDSGTRAAATIEIVSSPPGAKVTIDEAALPRVTPTSFEGESGKTYLIRVDLAGHQRWEREHRVPDEGGSQTVVARLDPIGVRIIATSEPSDAEVFINGTSVGRTPLELDGLDPETTKSIEVRLKGYRPVRRALDWSQETEKTLEFPLEQ